MVFESVVTDVLNRVLGDYVENLDRSQLKIAIWGGNVVLKDLILKENALEELNIPVQIVYGHLGKLELMIPWNNLYGASVVAKIEKLFLIVNPLAEIKYDPVKEQKMRLANKQAELLRVEEAKKNEAQKDSEKVNATFVEKLAAQIIKNVQIDISEIHVRYEDSVTNPGAPFSCGFTLHRLSVQTTDDNWRKTVVQEAVNKIFKVLDLEGLAVYWNPTTNLYSKLDKSLIIPQLQKDIVTKTSKPDDYQYMLGPINAKSKLILNPKPEIDEPRFSIPKVQLTLHMEQLLVSINKAQYQDLMKLADSMERMSKGAPYRKYRPNLKSYRGHYKEWWHFAYTCILEEEVRRRRRNWDWNHISRHRALCKEYGRAYQTKLANKGKTTPSVLNVIQSGEKDLDVFNLVVIRQQAEMEVARLGKQKEEESKSRGWFGWFSRSESDHKMEGNSDIIKQFQNAMTPEEKAKLFRAIDYQENSAPLHLPEEYVAIQADFRLDSLQVLVTDNGAQVIKAVIDNVKMDFSQRPSADAIKVVAQMEKFNVLGVERGELAPSLVTSKHEEHGAGNLLDVTFETNPLSKDCSQRIKVYARPLQVVYDAQTIIDIVKVFKLPQESSALAQLQVAAGNTLSDLKEKSTLSMQHAIKTHNYLDILIDIEPSFIVVPHKGVYTGNEACLVLKLGSISVKSSPRSPADLDIHRMFTEGAANDDIMKELISRLYDKMIVSLTEMQIVIADATEDWRSAIRGQDATPLHLLQPTTLHINIERCIVSDDQRLPKLRVRGQLEHIAINASEDRLMTLLELGMSIPLPQGDEADPVLKQSESRGSSLSLLSYLQTDKKKREAPRRTSDDEETVQMTQVEAFFVMKGLSLSVRSKRALADADSDETDDRFLRFALETLQLNATQKTFTLDAALSLGSVSLQHFRPGLPTINVIDTTTMNQSEKEDYLFSVNYCNVDKRSPDFRSHYGSVEQLITINFTTLKLLLHREGLIQLLRISNEMQKRVEKVQGQKDRIATTGGGALDTIMEESGELILRQSKGSAPKHSRHHQVESIQLKVQIQLHAVLVRFVTEQRRLADIRIYGLRTGLVLKQSYTQVDCSLDDILVMDPNPASIHSEIVKVLGGEVMKVRVVLFNLEQFPSASNANMSIDANISCLRIVFLNWFVSSMLDFMNNFQAAQAAIIEASSQAADAARANVASAYENSTKVSLKVQLSAPIIVVPLNSQSKLAVVVDLGQMSVNNTIYNLPTDSEHDVTVDDLTLALVNIKISTVRLSESNFEIERERMILSPISFNLHVKRSLSAWYKQLPDLDISGRLQTIVITVAHSDFKMLMKVLNQNLKEGVKSEPETAKKEPPKALAAQKVSTKPSRHALVKSSSRNVETKTPKGEVPRVTVNFAFSMDSLVIELVNTAGDSMMDLTRPLNETGLARFCLALLSVKGRMLSDDSMHTSVLLVDCTLDDTRPGREDKITRYLERRAQSPIKTSDDCSIVLDTSQKVRSMIDITYTVKNLDTFIDVKIFSFNLILVLDFLLKVAEFVTSGMAIVPAELDSNQQGLKVDKSKVEAAKKKVAAVAPSSAMMTINLKVEQPDIILIESLEDKDCDALVMNMELTFKMRSNYERTIMDGAIMDLKLYTKHNWSSEALHSAETPKHYLLEPCNISLAVAQPPDTGMHADFVISSIKINVSPEMIGLVNRVVTTMTRNEDSNLEEELSKIFTYDDLWSVKPFDISSHWFLKADLGEDALMTDFALESASEEKVVSGEICMMSSPSIVISVEMPVGNETIPILVMQAALSAQICDWSSELSMQSTWSMQVKYYNISKAVWEPLIEPIEMLKDNQYKHVPWELSLEATVRSAENNGELSEESSVVQAPPKMSVLLSSTEPLEMTVTGTCLDVLKQLSNAFSAALQPEGQLEKSKSLEWSSQSAYPGAPYVLHNCTGLTVLLLLDKSGDFDVFSLARNRPQTYKEIMLKPDSSVALQLKTGALGHLTLDDNLPQFKLQLRLVELDEEFQIAVERVGKRYVPLGRKERRGSDAGGAGGKHSTLSFADPTRKGLISEVIMYEGAINIYLRSVVKVENNLCQPVHVFYMTPAGNEVSSLGEVAPGDQLRLPLVAAHTPTAEIFFSVEGFTLTVSPFIWRELQQEVKITKLLQCESKDRSCAEKFYIQAVGTMKQVYLEDTNRRTLASACYNIVLKPAVKLQNCLPVEISVTQLGLKRTDTLKPGEMLHLSHMAPHKATLVVMLQNYMDKTWVCTKQLPPPDSELVVWSFDSHDSPAVMTLDLGVQSVDRDGTQVLSLYCPFWMLNKTGLTLAYRTTDDSSNVIHHRADNLEPVLFSFRPKNFFGKKKAAIRIEFGEWSEKFSLDVAGSSGVVMCRNEGRLYQVAVTNQLTFNSLTKMVIFTPFYIIINQCPFAIEFQEMKRSADKWLQVEGQSSKALWPISEAEDKLLLTRVAGSSVHALPFLYTEQHTVTLKLNNEYGGFNVEVQLSEGGTYITIRQYREGLAPALIINYTPHTVSLYEKENVNIRKLPKMHELLYTWENPAGPRVIVFEGHKREMENNLRQDGIGELQLDSTHTVYWVSFLNGMQRVLLLTDNDLLVQGIHTAGDLEQLDMDIILSVQGIGLSLINDAQCKEILYITVSNSGIVWEQCKLGSHRYKKMEPNKVLMYEDAYQRYQTECLVAKAKLPGVVQLDSKTEVDFAEMRQLRPTVRLVRRTLEPGLWASLGTSRHVRRLHARLHRLQIDEQLASPTFPVVLAPVPPPRSVVQQGGAAGMKPFVELSVVERVMEHTSVKQYKYCKLLVQEFHVKVDMGLIDAMMELFPEKPPTEEEALELFAADMRTAARPLSDVVAQEAASDQKNFYDVLHLSPLKVHLSFSLGGASADHLPSFVGPLLQSIGVTLTDMNDVVFKLAFYEKTYEFLSQREIMRQATRHYAGQAIKQLYVLVLGLDVIGNPYGLVIGLKKGVEDLFYEPFQGAIQGPGEFVEGLCLGVRSLVGHTVGGAAGAVSRIAGAMGSGLAALSLDEDFQKRRRDNRNKKPANLQEGLARSSKGLVMGMVDGVTGVFTKPITGAREEGVEGFFKGLGKGAVGLVARPTAGVVDFASGSLDAVKRAADMSEEVNRRRPPRYLPADTGVRPYSRVQAEGYKLLVNLEKGKFVSTDTYVTHVWVVPGREAVLCTDKRLLYLEKNNMFGGWTVVWTYLWSELSEPPAIVDKGIFIPTAKRKMLGMFAPASTGKLIPIFDERQKKYLQSQCEKLINDSR